MPVSMSAAPAPQLPPGRPSPSTAASSASTPAPLLVLCAVHDAERGFAPALRDRFRVWTVPAFAQALPVVARTQPALVVADIGATREGAALCAAVKRAASLTAVLVVTEDPAGVPDALNAGCDGILLKPFAPNLLFTRIGRLMRARDPRRAQYSRRHGRQAHSEPLSRGTNQFCDSLPCPQCQVTGVVAFEFHSHHRAWYACTQCRHVWIGAALDPSGASISPAPLSPAPFSPG